MRAHWFKSGVWLFTLSLVSLATAQSSLPPDQYISYRIHATPTDANSAVSYEVLLGLSAKERNGESVGWGVETLEVRQAVPGNSPNRWIKTDPTVSTSDGLWWVDHQSALEPQLDEFLHPPLMAGTANPVESGHSTLAFALQRSANPVLDLFEHTAGLSYSFSASAPGVVKGGTDEPAELDNPFTDPLS